MKKSNTTSPTVLRWLVFALVLLGAGNLIGEKLSFLDTRPHSTWLAQRSGVDKEADRILKGMSDYLTGLQQFSYSSKGTYEVVDTSKTRHPHNYSSQVVVKRPNKLRTEVTGDKKDGTIYYDGKLFTVMGKNANLYAQAPAPATLDEALDAARDKLQLDPPGADLIYTNPYKGLMEEVESGKVVGEEMINGATCSHLAFQSKEVDWEIWIEKGKTPWPRKYKIITKEMDERPEFNVEFSNWKANTSAAAADPVFAFTPPKNARKIEFMQVAAMKQSKTPKK